MLPAPGDLHSMHHLAPDYGRLAGKSGLASLMIVRAAAQPGPSFTHSVFLPSNVKCVCSQEQGTSLLLRGLCQWLPACSPALSLSSRGKCATYMQTDLHEPL